MDEPTHETEPFRLLFVCTGNTCRSPMAEVIARRRIAELGWSQVEVRSAGVGAADGSPASAGALRTAQRRGLDLSEHKSTYLTPDLARWSDLILTMSPGHLMRVVDMGSGDRAALISSFADGADVGSSDRGIPDPIGGPDEEYERTFDVLDDLIGRALTRIAPMVKP